MQNLHDDNHLDDLSRQAAEQFEADQRLHSWEKLQSRLEKELPLKKEKKRRYFFIWFFLLLVGGGAIFSAVWTHNSGFADPSDRSDKTSTQKNTQKNNTSGENKTVKPIDYSAPSANPQAPVARSEMDKPLADNPQADKLTGGTTKDQLPVTTANKQPPADIGTDRSINADPDAVKTTKQKQAKTQVTRDQAARRLSSNIPRSRDNKRNTTSKKQNNSDKSPVSKIITPPQSPSDNKPADSKADEIKTDLPDATDKNAGKVTDQPVADAKKPADSTADSQVDKPADKTVDKPADNTAPARKKTTRQPSVSASRWEFGLVYAPDLSTVKFTHTRKPGTNIGLMIGYNISRRFSVQAGALYTIKSYKSRGEDYHPPKGYWTDYVKLETVTADCNMWDIPINFRYNIVPKKSSNLFASAGLSSYLMRKEEYDFFYYYNGSPVNRSRYFETESKHWFSVLNLSIGYERQLSRNFSLQAEPFFKQPLSGVGFGKVKLNSTGVFLSVKYKPLANKKGK